MNLLIAGPSKPSPSTKQLIEEAKKDFKVDYLNFSELSIEVSTGKIDPVGIDLESYDFVIPRIDKPRSQPGFHFMRLIESMGVKSVYPAETVLIAHNKFLTLECLAKQGVPVPRTVLTFNKKFTKNALQRFDFPLVLKVVDGSGGLGVFFLENELSADSVINSMDSVHKELLVEEFLPNNGEDIRLLVVGDKVITSMKRKATKSGEFRSNLAAGGVGKKFEPSDELKQIAVDSARAINAKICGVDVIESEGKYKVIEVNINPGIYKTGLATDVNVSKQICEYVKGELE
ncbi:MAG: RimK family alpha-L-glutamate ligase [Candidatus Diapherotrites archaeon]|nr:RimK family alpha-L-glutamate ligase [Candidatus Diapherotrites archaeon]